MRERILVSVGGNALGSDFEGLIETAGIIAEPIAGLIEEGHEVVLCHGNGPQVGLIKSGLDTGNPMIDQPIVPMSECVAMSQAYIGYHLQNAIQNELKKRNIEKQVTTVVSRAIVDPADPAFQNPTKPVGAFFTKEEAEKMAQEGKTMVEDSGRGYREVVASPKPHRILEAASVKALLDQNVLVIAGGGGGIPVYEDESGHLRAIDAVIDKDWVSVLLAADTACDQLVILTGVEKVAINFNQPDQKWLDQMTMSQAEEYIKEGQFPAGSMLPKIEAAMKFTGSGPDRKTLITSLDNLEKGLAGQTGTLLVND